jgi:hypothetical protein
LGDKFADYAVTDVRRDWCTVEWRGWCGDRWFDHHFRSGGEFRIKEVQRYVDRFGYINALFQPKENKGPTKVEFLETLKSMFEETYGFLPESPWIAV